MRKHYQLLLTLSVTAASLSSCSRANYVINTTNPVSESVVSVDPASEVAASGTAMVMGTMPTEVVAPAREAAAALAHRSVAIPAASGIAARSIQATTAAPKMVLTKAERKALRQELKRQAAAPHETSAEGKSQLTAVLLAFFLGGLGIHRFYLGYTGLGILELLTFGVFGILALIDFIRILTGDLKPKDGEYAKKL